MKRILSDCIMLLQFRDSFEDFTGRPLRLLKLLLIIFKLRVIVLLFLEKLLLLFLLPPTLLLQAL